MELRRLLHHLWVKTRGFAQGNQLSVITAAQHFRGEDKPFICEVMQVDVSGMGFGVIGGQGHNNCFFKQQARLQVRCVKGQFSHKGDVRFCVRDCLGLAG